MTTAPRDRSPLPDPDRDRDVHALGHDHQSGSSRRPATHDHALHATHHDGVGPNALGNPSESHDPVEPAAGGWGHRLLMLACCIPMLVVVFALVASGVAGAGSIIFALLCVAMMAAMMFMMPGGHRH